MKSNIFKDDLARLIDNEITLTSKWMPIATNSIDLEGNFKLLKSASIADKTNMDIITKQLDSNAFRQRCIYDLFSEILGKAPTYLTDYSEDEVQKIIIYPDIIDKENNKYYLLICEEQIECPEILTTNQYYELYVKTMRKLLSTNKVTTKMIEETKNYFPNRFLNSKKR